MKFFCLTDVTTCQLTGFQYGICLLNITIMHGRMSFGEVNETETQMYLKMYMIQEI